MPNDVATCTPNPADCATRPVDFRRRRRPAVAVLTVLALVLASLTVLATPAWAAPPANDNLANAVVITGDQASITGSNVDATRLSGEPNHAGRPGNSSVWYRWTPPTTGWTTIDTCGSGISNVLAVYTGPNVTALTHVASSDFSRTPHRCPDTFHGAVHFLATAGTSYAITVDSFFTDQDGTFQLTLNPPPSNDAFADARRMPLTDFAADLRSPSDRGWSRSATVEPGEPLHATYGSASVWFDWAATGNGPVSVDTCGSDFDTILGVYTGTAAALTPVVANDDDPGAGCGENLSRVAFVAAIGQSYKIAVAGHLGASGEFTVTVHGDDLVVPNDNYADAIVLSGTSAADRSNNMLATEEPDEPIYFPTGFPPGRSGGRTIWYRWTAPTSGPYEVDTCDPGTDPEAQTVLGVYTGTAVDALTEVAAGSHAEGTGRCAGTDQSGVIFEAEAGTTYTFLVGGVWERNFIPPQAGTIVTSVHPADRPANDDTAFRRHLSGQTAAVTQPTAGAGPEPGEPTHAGLAPQASVWFDWVAPASAAVSVDTCGSGYDTVLAAYRGLSLAALSPVASNDDDATACGTNGPSRITFDATAGVRYWIAVDGAGGATGSLQLQIAQVDPEPTGWLTTGAVPRGPGNLTIRADLAELPDGDRLLWWTTLSPDLATGTVQAARVAADGTAGPVADLTTPGEPLAGVDLEVLPDGRLALYTVVHTDPIVNHTEVRLYAPDLTPMGAPVRISDDTSFVNSPNAVTGPDGTITFGWADSTYFDSFPQAYVAKVRRMAPDGTLGPVEVLSDPADQGTGWGLPEADDGPRLAVAPDGAVTAVWHWEKDQNTNVAQVQARRIDPAGTVGPLRVIDTTGNYPVVGVAPEGTAVVVYVDGDPLFGEENLLLAVHVGIDGTVGPPMPLDEAQGVDDYRSRDMRVAMSDTGRAFVIWHRTAAVDIGAARQIRGRVVNPDGTTGSLVELSDTSVSEADFVSYPRAAFDQWDNVTATWSMLSDDGTTYRGEARRVAADGTAGRLVQLTPTGLQGAVSDVLVDSTGVPSAAHIAITPPDVDAIEVMEFPVADLGVATTPAGPGSASVMVTNHGPRASTVDATHPITVDLTAPDGMTLTGATGSGWACGGASPLRCTRDTGLVAGAAAPAVTVSFTGAGVPSGPGSARVAAGLTTDPDPSDNRADIDLTPTCGGARVTVAGSGTISGTAGDDVILGSSGADVIHGLGGNDVICAGAGDDTVVGGPGDDTVHGEDGDDSLDEGNVGSGKDGLDGGAGRDTVTYAGRTAAVVVTLAGGADDGGAGEGDDVRGIEVAIGGAGADTLTGTPGDDRLVGNAGNDRLNGGPGADELVGGAGADVLSGGAGDDVLSGGAGNDTLNGENGDDRITEGDSSGANGADKIDGGNGLDEVSYQGRNAGVIVTLGSGANDGQVGEGDAINQVEAVVGTAHTDALTGSSGADRLVGGAGADALTGGGGDDFLVGGTGIDALLGGAGNDTLDGVDAGPADVLHGGAGTDTATSDPGDILLSVP